MSRLSNPDGEQFPFFVDYEIVPNLGETLHERGGVDVTVSGYVGNWTGGTLQSIAFYLVTDYDALTSYNAFYYNVTVANGSSGHFTINYKVDEEYISTFFDFGDNQIVKLYPMFTIFQYPYGDYSGNVAQTKKDTSQFFYFRRNLIILQSKEIKYARARLDGGKFVEDNEGHNVLCEKIAIAIDDPSYYTIDDIDIAKIQIFKNDNEELSVDIPRDKLALMLSENGYSETNYTSLNDTLFKDYDFEPGEYYKITISVGDTKAPNMFVSYIERAYANMHFSGASTGGVAFGMFSTATQGTPKFECAYPAYFYAGFSDRTRAEIANILYPVGSIYMNSAGAEKPGDLYGGEWELIDNSESQPIAQIANVSSVSPVKNKVSMWIRKSLNVEDNK